MRYCNIVVRTLIVSLIIGVVSGCTAEGPESAHPTLYNIVELVEMERGHTTFGLYTQDGDTPAMLSCVGEVVDTAAVHIGEALYLSYSLHGQGPFESGTITPRGYSSINNLVLQQAPMDDIVGWYSDPIEVESLWRAGSQVYMRLRLPYDETPRHFSLVVDESTVDSPVARAYLHHERHEAAPTFDRRYYVAVQLRNLWTHPDVRTLDIHIATPDGPRVFTLTNPKY